MCPHWARCHHLKQLAKTNSHKALTIHRESCFSGGSRRNKGWIGRSAELELNALIHINASTACIRGGSPEGEIFTLSTRTAGQVSAKRRGCSRQREEHVQRSNGERAMKHLETERTVRLGSQAGEGRDWGEMRPGRSSSCWAVRP